MLPTTEGLVTLSFDEGEIRARERLHAAAMAALPDGVIISDETGRIQAANAAAAKLFGDPLDDLIGAQLERLMPSRYATQHQGFIDRYVREGVGKLTGRPRELTAVNGAASSRCSPPTRTRRPEPSSKRSAQQVIEPPIRVASSSSSRDVKRPPCRSPRMSSRRSTR